MKNLNKLKRFVEQIPDEKIDMECFRQESSEYNTLKNCNTVGCIIGHCTGLMTKKEFKSCLANNKINFLQVSDILFNINIKSPIWDFLFSSNWGTNFTVDSIFSYYYEAGSQKKAFLKRLDYIIENKSVPEGFSLQRLDTFTEFFDKFNQTSVHIPQKD